jgi:O-acetyl-ADP-ribose deacetylase (regulator of RNase III)
MIIKEIEGDLLQQFDKETIDIIVHGCNCFHLMGAGIAGQIRYRYPAAYDEDRRTPCGDITKLGTYSTMVLKKPRSKKVRKVINMYTQFEPGARFEYKAFRDALKRLAREYSKQDVVFGFPEIGCGIGGGQWPYVKDILHKSKLKIIIVHYDQGIRTVGKGQTNLFSQTEG